MDNRSNVKEASDALRENASAILMPPPKPADSDDEDESGAFPPSRSTAISPLKRPRPSEDEEASTSPKRAKTGSEAESRVRALVESAFAAAMRGMEADLRRGNTEGHLRVDSSNSHSDEGEKEPNTTGPRRSTNVSSQRSPQSRSSSPTGIRQL
ncbi:hypothetical protein ARMGADRAFT_580933 [Armillaria gallica]|uniref:Uncharacterized protein n=1 Tax=Armillaria gallica TaxID=47427 RepID=A0A2H3DXH0_ARMGA|nr:hypothetical protein ARMGADRAFT_580933 [Armillaria gallica]